MTQSLTWRVAMVALVIASACTSGDGGGVAVPQGPSLSDVSMAEYSIAAPSVVPAGRALFRVRNAGHIDHQLSVVALPDDFPVTFQAQFDSPNRIALPVLIQLPRQRPGQTDSPNGSEVFAIDLAPGRYGLMCSLVDADQVGHERKGMTAIIAVA